MATDGPGTPESPDFLHTVCGELVYFKFVPVASRCMGGRSSSTRSYIIYSTKELEDFKLKTLNFNDNLSGNLKIKNLEIRTLFFFLT